jgi:Pyridoxal/pyridoxine/pyridoxamine kinase
VVLPILSCAGIETSVLPTAILSTHTGEFQGFTYRDLFSDMQDQLAHWQTLSLKFNALYSGFLGSFEQIALIERLFRHYKTPETLIMVDPAMADHGRLYTTYTSEMAQGTKRLCAMADIIVPNLTEAAILLDEAYAPNQTQAQIESTLRRLSDLGPSKVVLTGVGFHSAKLGYACYDRSTDTVSYDFSPRMPGVFYGTGDVFASALLAALLLGKSLHTAAEIANRFVHSAILFTLEEGTALRYGVAFERALPGLIQDLGLFQAPAQSSV